jgi:O-antigen/teichoic acid export membrane protein
MLNRLKNNINKFSNSAVIRSAALSAITDGIAAASGFIYVIVSTKILYTYLGQTQFGVWATVFSLTAALAFMDFGLGNAAIGALARAMRRGSDTLIRTVLVGLASSTMIVSAIIVIITHAALHLIDIYRLFGISSKDAVPDLPEFLQAFAWLLALSFPVNAMTQALRGLQRAWLANIARTLGYIAATIGVVVGARYQLGLQGLLLASLGAQLSTTLAIVAAAIVVSTRSSNRVQPKRVIIFSKRLLSTGGSFVLLNLTRTFAWLLDYFIIARLMGAEAAAALAIMQRMYQIVQIGSAIIGMAAWPAYSYLSSGHELKKLKSAFLTGFTITATYAISASFLIFSFREQIAALWLNTTVHQFTTTYALQAIWLSCEAAGAAFSIFLNARGIIGKQALGALTFAIVAFGLKLALVPTFGLDGLVSATLTGYIVGNIVLAVSIRNTALFSVKRART